MKKIGEILSEEIRSIAIAGHINPDGDCIGSCTALYGYLKKACPAAREIDLYLETVPHELCFLKGVDEAKSSVPESKVYDLVIVCDVSSYERIAVAIPLFDLAKKTVSIDHHISNANFAEINHVEPDASSCAEVLTGLFDPDLIDEKIAESLYTGIINDSGVFQYQNTSPDTMRKAAFLMEKGIDFSRIIEDSFNKKTFAQNRVLGYVLMKAELAFGGQCIVSSLTTEEMDRCGVTRQDLDGIVSRMRFTEGVEVAVFAYETDENVFKLSLRSKERVNVSDVAAHFGGGGHVRAAGCTIAGSAGEVLDKMADVLKGYLSL